MDMNRKISIKELADAVGYVKVAECVDYARIPSLIKMLGCKPMDFMAFLTENTGLVHSEERFSEGRRKSLGLCVIDVYEREEDNPRTAAGLKKMIADNENRIWVTEIRDVLRDSGVMGYYVSEDEAPKHSGLPSDARLCKWLWRNTSGKLGVLKGMGLCNTKILSFAEYGSGFYNKEIKNYISVSELESLRENGVFEIIMT